MTYKRLYFDTNILLGAHWPRSSSFILLELFRLARALDIALLIPEVVDIELGERFERELRESRERAAKTLRDLREFVAPYAPIDDTEWVRGLLHDNVERDPNTLNYLRDSYNSEVVAMKETWNIETVPIRGVPIRTLILRAARRQPPFREEGKGFQDSVILYSVMRDLSKHRGERAVFLSNDQVFKRPQILEELSELDLEIEICNSIREAVDLIKGQLSDHLRNIWKVDQRHAAEWLHLQLDGIGKFIKSALPCSAIPHAEEWISITRIVDVNVVKIVTIHTAYPPQREARNRARLTLVVEADIDFEFEYSGNYIRMLRDFIDGNRSVPVPHVSTGVAGFRTVGDPPEAYPIARLFFEIEARGELEPGGRYSQIFFETVQVAEFSRLGDVTSLL